MALAARRSFKHCSVSPEKESIREALSYFARAPVALKETSTENQQRIYRLNAEDPGQQEDEEEQFLGSRETSEQEREVEDEKEKEKEDWIKVLNEHQVQKREKRLEKQARKTERRKWKKKRDMKRGNRQLGMRSSCTAINSGACLHNADHTLSENK
ncbi:hypothetical protein DL98DRAFT_229593 [Cadophora sp. DSE1049]|nr:hypothetical protein DL98DRAFT_229593 [Cadophora sp. DSE1049]